MHFDLLIRNGTIYSSQGHAQGDVGMSAGKITAVGDLTGSDADEILDAKGLAVFPGFIDTQVHFREPGMEHKEDIQTGTQSAALGGVTTVLEMPNTIPATTSREALADKLRRAQGRSWANIAFFVGASEENAEELGQLEVLPGTPGVKIFVGSSTGSLLVPDDETLRKVMSHCKRRVAVHSEDHYCLEERKKLISAHPSPAEHPYLRAPECAVRSTQRLLRISEETGTPVHILHISTADELPLIHDAKERGLRNTAEVTPQHLFFSAPECYERLGTLAQMNPPLRETFHRDALRAALRDGLFDVIGSDHAPHTLQEKAKPYPQSPSGLTGVQTLLSVMLTLNLVPVEALVRLACEAPAELYGIRGKGHVREGFDADLTLVDLDVQRVVERSWIASKSGWSPYEGETLKAWPVHTIVNGEFVVRDGKLTENPAGRTPLFD